MLLGKPAFDEESASRYCRLPERPSEEYKAPEEYKSTLTINKGKLLSDDTHIAIPEQATSARRNNSTFPSKEESATCEPPEQAANQ